MQKRDDLLKRAAELQRLRNYREAANAYNLWLAKVPIDSKSKRVRDVAYSLGVVSAHMGNTGAALRAFERALKADAAMWQAALCLGRLYAACGRQLLAMWAWQSALDRIRSRRREVLGQSALLNEMTLCLMLTEPVRALQYCEQSLATYPLQPDVLERYLTMRRHQCLWPVIPKWLENLFPDQNMVLHMGPEMVLYEDCGFERKAEVVRHFLQRIQRTAQVGESRARRGTGKKLCIAYVYDDHIESDLGRMLLEQVAAHDRQEVYVYALDSSQGAPGDVARQMLLEVDLHVPIGRLTDEQVAQRVRELNVDALINPLGLWESARWPVYAHGAAPLQLGYGYRLGVNEVDGLTHVLTEEIASEIRLRKVAAATVPVLHAACSVSQSGNRHGLRKGLKVDDDAFVYGVACPTVMVGPDLWKLWMRVLRRRPEAVLLMHIDDGNVKATLRTQAEALGVDVSQLRFVSEPTKDLQAAWIQVPDVYLDSWPCSAGISGLMRLAHGVPVLTCATEAAAGEPVANYLRVLAMKQCIAQSTDEYVALALRMATDPVFLDSTVQGLLIAHQTHRLFDVPLAVRGLEAALKSALEGTFESCG